MRMHTVQYGLERLLVGEAGASLLDIIWEALVVLPFLFASSNKVAGRSMTRRKRRRGRGKRTGRGRGSGRRRGRRGDERMIS